MNYLNIDEIYQHSYLIIPKELFFNNSYKNLTNDARVTYSFLVDRLSLSVKNKWFDVDGKVFLIFSREQLADAVNVSVRTMIRIMKTLNDVELVEEKRQGLNKPNLIYIGKITYGAAKVAKTIKVATVPSKKVSTFNDYDQREYDFDDLEKKLLGWG